MLYIILITKLQSIRKKYILDSALSFYILNIYVSFSLFSFTFISFVTVKKQNQITAHLNLKSCEKKDVSLSNIPP